MSEDRNIQNETVQEKKIYGGLRTEARTPETDASDAAHEHVKHAIVQPRKMAADDAPAGGTVRKRSETGDCGLNCSCGHHGTGSDCGLSCSCGHHGTGSDCGLNCSCGHDHHEEEGNAWPEIAVGAVLFFGCIIAARILNGGGYTAPYICIFVLAYLLLGRNVLKACWQNILHGEIFDENFLMSLATVAAFATQNFPEAVGVMLFYRVGEAFEDLAVDRSRSRIMEAVDLRPETVVRETDGGTETIDAEMAEAGDILLVRPGDRIPLDGTVLSGESFLDTSAVTGEPEPLAVKPGDSVFSGCINRNGLLRLRADKVLEESMVTRILRSVEQASENKPKIDHFITRFAKIYTPAVVGLAVFTAVVIPLLRHEAFGPWIYTAISFLVMSCPCALVLSVPLAFFCGVGAGSGKGILFKGGLALETLAGVKAAVMDKTGTLTRGEFRLQKITSLSAMDEDALLALAASAEASSTHPIARSIVSAAEERGLHLPEISAMEEISGKGVRAVFDGRTLLCGNRRLMTENGLDAALIPDNPAGAEVYLALDGKLLGTLLIADAVKPDAAESIAALKKQGIYTVMLTGDGEQAAAAVAENTGVEEVHARLLPDEKLTKLQEVRERKGSVFFIGDGINDAPVLAGSDVGAAMGSGADAAIEAADVVFMNANMSAVPEALALAKKSTGIARQNVIFALAVKILVMLLGITGIYTNMWLAVFADTGVAFLCILNAVRILLDSKRGS